MDETMRLCGLIAMLQLAISAMSASSPLPKECPHAFGCFCDFSTNALICSNITEVPKIPGWINSVSIQHGDYLDLRGAKLIPEHVREFVVKYIKRVRISGDFFSPVSTLHSLVISGINRIDIPRDLFKNVRKLTYLAFSRCNLRELENETLSGLKLSVLDLSGNHLPIRQIVDAVCSISGSKIGKLFLASAGLHHIPKRMITCLQSQNTQRKMSLNMNQNDFSNVSSLHALSKLRRLENLFVSGSNISRSETLNFVSGGKNITSIDLSDNHMTEKDVREVICKLNPKFIRRISVNGNNIGSLDDDIFACLDSSVGKANIASLSIRSANITGVSNQALVPLHGSIDLDLSENKIPVDDLTFISKASRVMSLHLNKNKIYDFPNFKVNGTCLRVQHMQHLHLADNFISSVREMDTECLVRLVSLTLTGNSIVNLPERALIKLMNLKQLSLGSNVMRSLGKRSLPVNLTSLDLEGSKFGYYGLVPIMDLANIQTLVISGTPILGNLFQKMTKLRVLKIKNGKIKPGTLPSVFRAVNNVESLELSDVNMQNIPEQIISMKNLQTLILAGNKIQTISQEYIPTFRRLGHVNLGLNPFECNCSMLPFSMWLRNSTRQTKISNLQNTKCFSPGPYKDVLLYNFDEDCRDLLPMILLSVLVPLAFVVAVLTALSVRYRGYIRYGLMLIRAKWKGYAAIEGRSFKYDAFVSYNKEDAPWVCQMLRPKLEDEAGYQICLHDRDFTVGEDIVDNIITSIDESRKTILILSNNFAQSQWCQLEMSLAQHKLFEENRDVLILIRLGDVADNHITRTMRLLMRTKTYITWPDGSDGVDLFWKNLIFALRRPPGVVMEEPAEWPIRDAMLREA